MADDDKVKFEFILLTGCTQAGQEIRAWIGVPEDAKGKVIAGQGYPIYFDNVTLKVWKGKRKLFWPKSPVGVKI